MDPQSFGMFGYDQADGSSCGLMANSLRKVITTALMAPFEQAFIEATHPTQYGSGEKAGGSQLVHGVLNLMEENLDFTCGGLDVYNGFNEGKRRKVTKKLWEIKELRPLWYYI